MTSDPTTQPASRAARPAHARLAASLLALTLAVLAFASPSAEAAFPGQNGLIAFERDGDIYTMNPDGTAQLNRTITRDTSETQPAFSADASKIAFTASGDVYVMNVDGTERTRLTNTHFSVNDTQPTFSRDGKKIVFESDRVGNSELYSMDVVDANGDGNGDNLVRLTATPTVRDIQPVVSPDGKKIAYRRIEGGASAIYIMNFDGTGVTVVSEGNAASPDFSPDGTTLTFDRANEIYKIKVDGTGLQRLTNDTFSDGNPVFSPDGTMIAFQRSQNLTTSTPGGIYTMNAADGSNQTHRSVVPTGFLIPGDNMPSWGVTPASADKAAPQTTITSGPSGVSDDTTPTFEFSSDETGSSFECRVDGAAFASCSSPHTTAPLADGPHTFEVRATDVAGNTDGSPASRAFTIDTAGPAADTTPPDTTITSGASGTTNDSTPQFTFSSDESSSTFACRVDAEAFTSCTSPHTTAPLSEGTHTFEVRATDAAGNADPTPAIRTFTIDTTAPQTTINSGPTGTTNDNTPTYAFFSDETGSSFECRVDAAAFASCSSPHTTAPLGEGSHTFEVRAIDGAGNVDQTPASRTFTVNTAAPPDTTAPQTTIDSGPTGTTNDNTPTYAFSSDEAGSSFECRVDAAAFVSCGSPHTTAPLAEGSHTFEVRATDGAENVDQTPASRTFTVNTAAPSDTTAPQTTIDSGPTGTTNDNTPTFEFSSDEAGFLFECKLDTGSFAACTSPHTTAALGDGEHTFQVRATDAAGNLDQTPASRTFTVSTAASPPPPSPSPPASLASPLPPPPGPAAVPDTAAVLDTTRPLIGALSLSRTRFRAAGSGPSIASALGTRVFYALSEPASVSFKVERALSGRRVSGRCVKTTRANRSARSCTRYPTMRGSFSDRGERGTNRFIFGGRLAGSALRPGRYRLRATARDRAGNTSSLRRSSFQIVRR